jgi:GNAT superfamily N-acetyltransferase
MDITVTPFDASDEKTAHEALAVITESVAHDIPDFPPVCPVNFLGGLTHPWPGNREVHAIARVDGVAVGQVEVGLPTLDNLENADVQLNVLPKFRRRGVGTALYRWAEDTARANGRKRLLAMTVETLPGGPVRDGAGVAFAAGLGFKRALSEVRRRLDVTALDQAALDRMLSEGWAKAPGYSLVRWNDETPAEFVDDVAYLDSRLLEDAPMGDLEWEPMKVDAARIRRGEEVRKARARRQYNTGVKHDASGRLVAWTTLEFEKTTPWHAFQNITIVEPRHRGHRLGAIVKVENLRRTMAAEPELRIVDTWNAAVNDHMISINEAMGFRPVDAWTDNQISF